MCARSKVLEVKKESSASTPQPVGRPEFQRRRRAKPWQLALTERHRSIVDPRFCCLQATRDDRFNAPADGLSARCGPFRRRDPVRIDPVTCRVCALGATQTAALPISAECGACHGKHVAHADHCTRACLSKRKPLDGVDNNDPAACARGAKSLKLRRSPLRQLRSLWGGRNFNVVAEPNPGSLP